MMKLLRWIRKIILCNILHIHNRKKLIWMSIDDRYHPSELMYKQVKCRWCRFSVTKDEFRITVRKRKTRIR